MRLLVSGLWAAHQPSGICRHTINLLRAIVKTRVVGRVYFALGEWQLDYFNRALGLARLPIEVVPIDIPSDPIARNFWYAFQLPHLATRISADVVHVTFPAPVLRSKMPCPVVTTIHDLYPYDMPENFSSSRVIFNRIFLRQAMRASDRLVCVSDFTLARLRHYEPAVAKHKAERIYNSVQLEGRPTSPPAALQLSTSPFLLSVAQHRSNKNLPALLRGFQAAKGLCILEAGTRLVLLGSNGPETAHIVRLAKELSLMDDLLLLSAVADGELVWLYQNCRAVVSLSTIEGFGLPVAEALYFGARVLCSDIPAHREIGLEDCEFIDLMRAGRSNELAAAIGRAVSRKPGSSASLHRFSLETVGSAYLALYQRVLRSITSNTEASQFPPAASRTASRAK